MLVKISLYRSHLKKKKKAVKKKKLLKAVKKIVVNEYLTIPVNTTHNPEVKKSHINTDFPS